MTDREATFEHAMAELEERVRQLEGGDLSLEDSLRLYEEGMALAERCHRELEAAEQRVVQLVRGQQGVEERALPDVGEGSE